MWKEQCHVANYSHICTTQFTHLLFSIVFLNVNQSGWETRKATHSKQYLYYKLTLVKSQHSYCCINNNVNNSLLKRLQ